MIEHEIRARLLADATVSGLITSRMYPQRLPQKPTLPALVYSRISRSGEIATADGPDGLPMLRLQIDCWDRTNDGAKELAAAVRAVLNGGRWPLDGIQSVFQAGERDLSEDEVQEYRVSQDYLVYGEE
jgi:hypothetical protein